jgi:tetratricopeptide (TPR) repeat protein
MWWLPRPAFAQSQTDPAPIADARAQVAAALYAASATQAASERRADSTLRAQRTEIERLRSQGRAQAVALMLAQEKYVAALAARDRAYAEEIAVFRSAVQDIAATPNGVAALARFTGGDEIGALSILDDLRSTRDVARQRRADVESAAEGRRIATLALDARKKGKVSTAQVIARYEEVTRLDAGGHWDWVELGRLYRAAGRLPDARRAAQTAADTAAGNRDRSVALDALGDVLAAQGDRPAALASYRAAFAIQERLAQTDAGNTDWQRDVSLSHDRIGDVLVAQGDQPGALTSYRAGLAIQEQLARTDPDDTDLQRDLLMSHERIGRMLLAQGDRSGALASYRAGLAIAERLAQTDAGNTDRQSDLSLWHDKIGDLLLAEGDRPGALARYREGLAIRERLAQTDAGNAQWQRSLLVTYVKLMLETGDQAYAGRALDVARAMQRRGMLVPADRGLIEALEKRIGR